MTLPPTISIIIPVYNAEKHLSRCIESIISQTYSDYELILVNDGSKDHSLKICREYATKDKRIIVLTQENCGVSTARNRGVEHSKGEWITFIDADDYVEDKYLEYFCRHIPNKNNSLVVQGYTSINNEKEQLRTCYTKQLLKGKEVYLILEIHGGVWGKLFNSYVINRHNIKFDKELSYSEDAIFLLEYVLYCDEIKILEEYAYNYMVSNSGLSCKFNSFDNEFKLFNKFYELTTMLSQKFSFELSDRIKRDRAMILMRSIYCLYIHKEKKREQRIKILKEIKYKHGRLIKEYYTPQIYLMQLLKSIFLVNIQLFDLICCLKYKNKTQYA